MAGRRRWLAGVAMLCALMVAHCEVAVAEGAFPDGQLLKIIVPSTAGPPPDAMSRIVAAAIAENEGWRVIVENKPGALQTIAMSEVLSQPANGLTIFPMTLGAVATPSLLPERGLKLQSDFAAVAKIAIGYTALVVHPSLQVSSLEELIAYLKSHPNQVNYSSGGIGTPGHLLGEKFRLLTGTAFTIVQYSSSQQRMTDLIGGHTQFSFANTPSIVEFVAAGKLRAIAIAGPRHLAALGGVPTVGEQGFPDLAAEDWVGFVVKGGTDQRNVEALNAAVNRALLRSDVRTRLLSLGYDADSGTPEQLQRLIEAQIPLWNDLIKRAGIQVPR